eukprot:CAMPEP_0169468780 /NCGR_PEP_ID=MMETSP1042-20121227/23110_1 /TAXON_ID=464988 /ORGANISM="Hemiselmis andersenii, Strain CCMP1180" /LENGTH=476 /DNA_ID=CAMNT_0009582175 /DNA_START=465 /DNA_END=1895 /DNA_ORIENTATION=+
MFGSAAINNLWVTYYIQFFSRRVNTQWFYIGQVVYMLWNSFNDPLFGWISDAAPGLTRRRTPAIKYGGPLWAIVFAMAWQDLGGEEFGSISAGLHFTMVLCLYDGLLTLVELNHAALMPDLTTSTEDRTKLNNASAAGAILGSLSSFFGHMYWSQDAQGGGVGPFRRFSTVVALLATIGFAFSAEKVCTDADRHRESKLVAEGGEASERKKPPLSMATVVRQMMKHKNFGLFTLVSALQVFECTFEKNFLSIFVDLLMQDVSKHTRSLIISTSFVLPWIVTILLAPAVSRFGVRSVIIASFCLKVLLGVIALAVGLKRPLFIGAFAVMTRVFTECVCRLGPLVLSDLVDEDKVLHSRARTMSAMFIGTNSFFTKPGESLAPMLGWAIVNSGGGQVGGEGLGKGVESTLFYCLVGGPLVVASVQLVFWNMYSLHGSYLQRIKDLVNNMDVEGGVGDSEIADVVDWPQQKGHHEEKMQ